ncbi:hypothetical protein [Jatrophihabitans endophyticus]|uniref:hypothetical protein n=1 Tax=Jatrophihabitans endophyticus TaxID=1206085 RepID=UPI0019F10A28|nr:hypothetical protein [Jatrophihabitans endophyticus]MBE7187714.1 hypothetical protein [Jatrophihabitans endophyticus]
MTDPTRADERPQPSRELQVLRASQDRVLEAEGIPMILALVGEVDEPPPAGNESVRAEGRRLAAAMDHYREHLVPSSRDDDLGCLISVLQAVSYDDMAETGGRLSPGDVDVPSRRAGQ